MTGRLLAHSGSDGVPDNWREQLSADLGYRPRRLGTLTELAMFGARACLKASGEPALPAEALIRVVSCRGHAGSFLKAFKDSEGGAPMPFAFLQSQPSQLLSALAATLQWRGDACFVMAQSEQAIIELVQTQWQRAGVLLGWVEEPSAHHSARSEWWRIVPMAGTNGSDR